jgi:hypothetical protein
MEKKLAIFFAENWKKIANNCDQLRASVLASLMSAFLSIIKTFWREVWRFS